ncbi:MAG TPA: type II toxin-antitoxin system VapB family antitoxin [Rhizomicrobium sp.]
MAFHVKDPATDRVVRKLAELKGKGITETIRDAVEREYDRARREGRLEAIKEIQAKAAAMARPGGLPADKAFYDWLSGEE